MIRQKKTKKTLAVSLLLGLLFGIASPAPFPGMSIHLPWSITALASEYPLTSTAAQTGLGYCDVLLSYDVNGKPVMERRLRQDGYYGLFNYFGLSDALCRALYGESDQIGTGERASDGDSLLVLSQTPLYQGGEEQADYCAQRDALAQVIRSYLDSFSWQTASELDRAKHAALYIASSCTYDMDLYTRFEAGEDTQNDLAFTAYGCLVEHSAVCEGMSISYQLLTRAMGLNAFCAPDDSDSQHMFAYVQADGNWYKVDLSVIGDTPEVLVNSCFKQTANEDVNRILLAYETYCSSGGLDFTSLTAGGTWDLTNHAERWRVY